MATPILLTLFGLALLLVGADVLVRGASKAAELLRAPSLLVGLTVVAWGTSAPELSVSLGAALDGRPAVALGNVGGSNLFNVLVILGLSALITPLAVERAFVRRDLPILLIATAGTWFLLIDGALSRMDAGILLVGWVAYSYVLFLHARRTRTMDDLLQEKQPEPVTTSAVVFSAGSILGGLAALGFGARWMVNGAVELAMYAGVSERVIALTLVAAGTSLPEVAASVIAAVRGERDLAVGNVIGSNVFNLLAVLGMTGLMVPSVPVPDGMLFTDMPLVLGTVILVLPLAVSGWRINRLEGALLLLVYGGYMTWLFAAPDPAPHWPVWAFLGATVAFAGTQMAIGLARKKQS